MGLFDLFKKSSGNLSEKKKERNLTEAKNNDAIAAAEGFLEEVKVDLTKADTVKLPFEQLATLGGGVASVLPSLRTVTSKLTYTDNGLYRCVFPKGVSGYLATAHNDGLNIGTIMNKSGIAGQARWLPQGQQTVSMTSLAPLNPATMMMAAALIAIEKKLDTVIELQKKMLSFLEEEKQSKIEGDLITLIETTKSYKHKWDDSEFINAHRQEILDIKRSALQNLCFYQKQIADVLKSQVLLVSQRDVASKKSELYKKFQYYRMSLYNYSYASFLEVMLQGKYSEGYVGQIRENILEHLNEYRVVHDKCYKILEEMSSSSVENQVLKGLGSAGKAAGKFLGSIPGIKEGPVDKWLIEGGTSVEKTGENAGKKTLAQFLEIGESGCEVFADNLANVDRLFNKTREIYLDRNNIYLVA